MSKFENIIMSFKAVDGGQINPKEGKVAAINAVIGTIGEVVSIVPLVGEAGEKLLKWTIQTVLQKIDEDRELNTANQVGKISWKDATKEIPIFARMLTVAFSQQLLELPTPEEAERTTQLNPVKKGIHKLNALVLKGQFIPPAEIEAMVAMTWVVEFLYETPDIGKQVREKSLANVFFSAIAGQSPPDKVNAFWKSITKQMGGISTKCGATWNSEDMYIYTGLRTEDGNFCVHTASKPETYGWRLVTLQVLTELVAQLQPSPVATRAKLPPAYLLTLKMPESSHKKRLPSNSSTEDTSADNSLYLPMPPANSDTPATTLTFRRDEKEVKEAAEEALQVPQSSSISRTSSPVPRIVSPASRSASPVLKPKSFFQKLVGTRG